MNNFVPIELSFNPPAATTDAEAAVGRGNFNLIITPDENGEYVFVRDQVKVKWTIGSLRYVLAMFVFNGITIPFSSSDNKVALLGKVDECVQIFLERKMVAKELPPTGSFSFPVAPLSRASGDRPPSPLLGPRRATILGTSASASASSSSSSANDISAQKKAGAIVIAFLQSRSG